MSARPLLAALAALGALGAPAAAQTCPCSSANTTLAQAANGALGTNQTVSAAAIAAAPGGTGVSGVSYPASTLLLEFLQSSSSGACFDTSAGGGTLRLGLVLGSISGSAGIPLADCVGTVPVTFDGYTVQLLAVPAIASNPFPVFNAGLPGLGVTPSVQVPASTLANFVGTTFTHAFVIVALPSGGFPAQVGASNAVTLTVAP